METWEPLCTVGCEMGQLLWEMVLTAQEMKRRITIGCSHSIPGNTPKISDTRNSTRYLSTCIPNSTTHNSPKVGTTQVSCDGWRDRQIVVYIYKAMLFNLQKEGPSDTSYNRDESWRHYVNWNKPATKGHILYVSTFMEYPQKENPQR